MIFAIPVVLVGLASFISWMLSKTAGADSPRKQVFGSLSARLYTAAQFGFAISITSVHSAPWARWAEMGAWLTLVALLCVGGRASASRLLQVGKISAMAAAISFFVLDRLLTHGLNGVVELISNLGIILAGGAFIASLFWIGDQAERRMGVGAHETGRT